MKYNANRRRTLARVVCPAVACLLGFALFAPSAAIAAAMPTQLAPATGSGARRVVIFGDSLTWAAADDYRALTSAALTTSVNAVPGTHMLNWVPLVPAAAAQNPAAVVLALGTNDAAGWAAWGQYGYDPVPAWAQALDSLAGHCVVILQPRDYDSAGTMSLLWSRLAPVIASHPNVHVYDGWRVATAQYPEWIGPDGVHATAYGEYAYGWSLFLAQHQCP